MENIKQNNEDNMIDKLIKLANHLDSRGFEKEADYLDQIIKVATGPEALNLMEAPDGSFVPPNDPSQRKEPISPMDKVKSGNWKYYGAEFFTGSGRENLKMPESGRLNQKIRSLWGRFFRRHNPHRQGELFLGSDQFAYPLNINKPGSDRSDNLTTVYFYNDGSGIRLGIKVEGIGNIIESLDGNYDNEIVEFHNRNIGKTKNIEIR